MTKSIRTKGGSGSGSDLQQKVGIWADTLLAGAPVDPEEIVLHGLEEMVELCLEFKIRPERILQRVQEELDKQAKKPGIPGNAAPEECGDILLILHRLAHHMCWDLEVIGYSRLEYNIPHAWRVTPGGDFRRIKK